ncbi:hypothetical protein CXB51_010698 [Gossypium anomalum]|uniref:Retrovirus-related Pol polyprotein from transposon TNT 1-94 n=1 Tax=Gossypium anomalum TaxID=47600 RepID=A0A8J5ZDH5_9ROSI|nr:hypothetical protein CXB51_010698 [Gossypium anomalum]
MPNDFSQFPLPHFTLTHPLPNPTSNPNFHPIPILNPNAVHPLNDHLIPFLILKTDDAANLNAVPRRHRMNSLPSPMAPLAPTFRTLILTLTLIRYPHHQPPLDVVAQVLQILEVPRRHRMNSLPSPIVLGVGPTISDQLFDRRSIGGSIELIFGQELGDKAWYCDLVVEHLMIVEFFDRTLKSRGVIGREGTPVVLHFVSVVWFLPNKMETHARTLWEKLESLYASRSGKNKLFFLKKMMALKYKEGTYIADHVSEFQSVMNQLLGMGVKFDDEIFGVWLLATLPDSWETFRVSLINSAPQGIITLDLAKSGVLNEEVRRRSQSSTSQSEVLVIKNRERNRDKDRKGRDKIQSKSRSRYKNLKCHHCDLLVICDENLVNLVCNETSWVIDTGASLHVTSRKDFFTFYTPGDFGVLKMGNDGLVSVIGMGNVSLLDDEGFCNTFSKGQWKLTKGSLVVARGKKSSNLYLIQALNSRETVNVTVNDSSTELWHKRLSHMSENGLNCLAKKNQLSGNQTSENTTKDSTVKWAKALNVVAHVINLSPSVPLRGDVPDRVWFGKDVSYDHLRVFDGEFGYRLYDPVQKKLVRSRDVVFIEDQTIDDIDKTEKVDSQDSGDLIDVNLVPLDSSPDPIQDDVHGDYSSNEYVLLTDGGEPECYEEAIESECKDQWVEAMKDELQSLHENHTFELVKLPKGKRALKHQWVYRLKQEEKSSSPRYKARLVVKGYTQKRGVDFEEIFSPVVKMSSIRTILSLAACYDLEVEQMDVKTAFLHGDLEEELYMEQPEGFVAQGKEDYVCRLKKSLYGLKQAPRQWYKKFESIMGEQGYKKTTSDHCVFVKRFSGDDFIILLLYVDYMLIVGQNTSRIEKLKQELSKSFAMKDLGPAKQILGIRLTRDRKARKLWLSQERYIEKVLQRFSMDKAKAVNTPFAIHFRVSVKHSPSTEKEKEEMQKIPYSSAVGSLIYAMVCTRPDLAYVIGTVSQFLSNPGREHWNAVKWIMRYLRGTSNMKLCFGNEKPVLVGYTDSDMAEDIDLRRSTSGYLITYAGGVVALQSRLQKCVALSTIESEKYVLYCDSQSAIHLGKNSTFHARSKNIDVRYYWIRDVLEAKLLELEKIHINDNGADMLTKALPRGKFEACCLTSSMEAFPT